MSVIDVLVVLGVVTLTYLLLVGVPWLLDTWREFKRVSQATQNMREVCIKIYESEGTWVWKYETTRWDNNGPILSVEGITGTYEYAAEGLRNTMVDYGSGTKLPSGIGSDTERLIYM